MLSASPILLNEGDALPAAWRTERRLLLLAALFLGVNFLALGLIRPQNIPVNLLAYGVWSACSLIGHRMLNRLLPNRDAFLFGLVMFLSGWGLLIIDRLVPRFAERQTLWLVISLAVMLTVIALPDILRWLRLYRYLWLTAGLGLLFSTILFGTNPSAASGAPRLWLGVENIFFQPSEALKVILVAFLASYLAEQSPMLRSEVFTTRRFSLSPRFIGPILLMWSLSIIVLVWQRDLGTAVLFFAVFLVLIYTASGSTLILIGGGALIVLAGVVAYQLFDVVQLRVDIWLNPWPEANTRAYQLVQSLQAFASGGIFGQGIAQGFPEYIPVVHSDFAFAALAEEWGLVGVVVTVAAFSVLVMRGLHIALLTQSRPFHSLLAVGLSTLLAVQTILIMGGTTRLLPLTGVTLPFVSYGGSSLLVSFGMIGLLLRLSADESEEVV